MMRSNMLLTELQRTKCSYFLLISFRVTEDFFLSIQSQMQPLETRGISRTSPTSKLDLSVSLMSFSCYLRTSFSCGKGPRYPSVDTVKLEKTLKNMSNIFTKIVKKSIFIEIKLAGSLIKKHTSFPLKTGPVI